MFGVGDSEAFIILAVATIPVVHLLLAVRVGRDAARRGDNVPVRAVGPPVGGLLGPALDPALGNPDAPRTGRSLGNPRGG